MAKYQYVQVGKHKIKLSNLDKIIYPEAGIIKAQIIEYYYQIAPILLRYIKRRPISAIRFPDGIQAHQFYQKDKPEWTPEWIESIALGKERKKKYILPTDEATIVWMANLASLELHTMQFVHPDFERPDHFVFDLDPDENISFDQIKESAQIVREYISDLGYHPFLKTTGRKGLHIYVPIDRKWDNDTVFESIKSIAEGCIKQNPNLFTLNMLKDKRKGKILLDIYRNRASQTAIAPYSLRGIPGAPISMPLTWEELEGLESSQQFNILNAMERIHDKGDAWEGFRSFAVDLHNHRENFYSPVDLGISEHHKTPEQLESYEQKRDFQKTTEPIALTISDKSNHFVVHRHHASRLHYDLRLEKNGVLLSWAIPRGMPHEPGVKRLAVETEPHPVKYLDFEGEIPKGEYGGGKMWIFAKGKYSITKEKKNGFYFHLSSPEMDGEYRMHNTREKEWLLEKVDRPYQDLIFQNFKPMLASSSKKIPTSHHFFEIKWDGIRAIIIKNESEIKIYSRNGKDFTHLFPELTDPGLIRCSNGVLDAEIVCLNEQGAPVFKKVITRMHQTNPGKIERSVSSNPAYAYIFDCLYLDGKSLIRNPLSKRREFAKDVIKKNTNIRFSDSFEDGEMLFEMAKKMNLEGIMAKESESIYEPGKRTNYWKKIKFRDTTECIVLGFTEGNGERQPYFGALHIGEIIDSKLQYRGKVGTGFDMNGMKAIKEKLDSLNKGSKPFEEKVEDELITIWVENGMKCQIEFASVTDNGTFREPVLINIE